ncbi:MAG: hypothetical protein IPP63_09160 [Chloracidobacterium sp.]|nr:hypothetical protein [Chloracidobacterium sp.]
MQARSIEQVTQESRQFAANEFMPAMMRIDTLPDAERGELADKFSSLTGLSRDFIERANFRVDLDRFQKELLRSERRTTGRLDSRFKGIDRDAAGESPDSDPSMNAIRPPYTAAFNAYVRGELGFKTDTEYYILGGGVSSPWNWNVANGYADTSIRMKDAMAKNPYMKIFMAQGYYDMATPFLCCRIYRISDESRPDASNKYFICLLRSGTYDVHREKVAGQANRRCHGIYQ